METHLLLAGSVATFSLWKKKCAADLLDRNVYILYKITIPRFEGNVAKSRVFKLVLHLLKYISV